MCAPMTNGQGSCFQLHSQRRLFQSANASLERTAGGSTPNQPLETPDVLHRETRPLTGNRMVRSRFTYFVLRTVAPSIFEICCSFLMQAFYPAAPGRSSRGIDLPSFSDRVLSRAPCGFPTARDSGVGRCGRAKRRNPPACPVWGQGCESHSNAGICWARPSSDAGVSNSFSPRIWPASASATQT